MKPIEISKGIYSVGVIDWNVRDFHGYSVEGTSYNSFLIVDKKIALIDTVKKEFAGQLIDNISQIVDPQKIDYVISNHTEMDHSGALPHVMHVIGEDKPVYCSKMGLKNLPLHYHKKLNYQPVDNGGELNLGDKTLTFLETRMLHWPDSMFTYLKEDGILFSSDAFGQHYAGYEMFDDVIGHVIMPYAKKYFANILLLFSPSIIKLIEHVTKLGLKINMICPDHGIIWRKDPQKIVNAYAAWSNQETKKKALVIYDTMWQSTQNMAEAISKGLSSEGIDVVPMNIRKWHRSDIMTEVLDAKAIIVGSPTLNNGLFPTICDILTYIKGLKPKNKIGAAFGSYGWSGEAVSLINKELESMKIELIDSGITVQYVPDKSKLDDCFNWGKKIAKAILG
ncbi:MAG: flavodoxin domain-containing protein [Desulfobacterales bacterium]|nr:flavodoxin domain-containing protein [Desulfobacterales bacterium]MBF0397640.1 flavodoxin domain-containing protein [Desulfobacterales bacterium]